jgi:hypothetical protein
MFYTIFGNCSVISVYCPLAIGKPRVSPLLSLNMMKVRNQPKLRRVCPLGNPNNPVVILRFATYFTYFDTTHFSINTTGLYQNRVYPSACVFIYLRGQQSSS